MRKEHQKPNHDPVNGRSNDDVVAYQMEVARRYEQQLKQSLSARQQMQRADRGVEPIKPKMTNDEIAKHQIEQAQTITQRDQSRRERPPVSPIARQVNPDENPDDPETVEEVDEAQKAKDDLFNQQVEDGNKQAEEERKLNPIFAMAQRKAEERANPKKEKPKPIATKSDVDPTPSGDKSVNTSDDNAQKAPN